MIKVSTNALTLAEVFETKLTLDKLGGWAQAGLGNAIDATGQISNGLSFPEYVRLNWLNGQVMRVSSPDTPEAWKKYKERGWHHRDKVQAYSPKPRNKWYRWKNVGIYDGNHSLNYLMKNLRKTGNANFMSRAWRKWRGNTLAKEELNWMFERGMDKVFREEQRDESVQS